MGLDIRWPIGLMFSLIGALLIIEGIVTGASDKALGTNIDLLWGIVLLIFGALMLFGAISGGKKNTGGK
ncbi:MAG TPA: hypothetical protein VGI03_11900 [Verrucomicrobiae bacterium]|jgi:uncharacterized membrane protein HdeD (DUF308 family)